MLTGAPALEVGLGQTHQTGEFALGLLEPCLGLGELGPQRFHVLAQG